MEINETIQAVLDLEGTGGEAVRCKVDGWEKGLQFCEAMMSFGDSTVQRRKDEAVERVVEWVREQVSALYSCR